MGQTRRKEGDVSLDLMHHSLCVRQPHLVLHAGDLVASNHAVDFFMNFGCRDMNHECYARDVPWTPGNYLKCLQYATESGLEKAPNQDQRHVAKQPITLLLMEFLFSILLRNTRDFAEGNIKGRSAMFTASCLNWFVLIYQ